MFDRALRPVKDRMLGPAARLLAGAVHPTVITALSLAAGLGCAALLLTGDHAPALALWVLNRLLDGLDGLVARIGGRQSDLGGYLDILADFMVYAAIPIALSVRSPAGADLPLAVLLAAFYVNAASWMYLSALLENRAFGHVGTTSVAMPGGLIEGSETILFFTGFILLPALLPELFWAMSLLVGVTIVQRLWWATRNLAGRAPDTHREATVARGTPEPPEPQA